MKRIKIPILFLLMAIIVGSSFTSLIVAGTHLYVNVTMTYETIWNLNDREDPGDGDYLLKFEGYGPDYKSSVATNDYPDTGYPTLTLHNNDFGWWAKTYSGVRIDNYNREWKLKIKEQDGIWNGLVLDARLFVKKRTSGTGTFTFTNIYAQKCFSYSTYDDFVDNSYFVYWIKDGVSAPLYFETYSNGLYISVSLYYYYS